jgi:RNA polymerase sigma factor (sigma-70 family)
MGGVMPRKTLPLNRAPRSFEASAGVGVLEKTADPNNRGRKSPSRRSSEKTTRVDLLELLANASAVTESGGECSESDRALKIVTHEIEYVYSRTFEAADAEETILGPYPDVTFEEDGSICPNDLPKAPAGTPPYLASLYAIPLLTHAQEQYLFRKMNFLKHRADQLRRRIDPDAPDTALMNQIEKLLQRALDVRNQIVRSNLRLVVSIAKNFVDSASAFDDAVSDGNVPLLRAVEIFDFDRGTRFSTYATWAVRNSLLRSTSRNRRQRSRYLTGRETAFESVADQRTSRYGREKYHRTLRAALDRAAHKLDPRDRKIVMARFGLGDEQRPRKFREIAESLNISAERVRQLLARSLNHMRQASESEVQDLL